MKNIKIDEMISQHNNNLALMQFICSIFVIFSHSYPIAADRIDILGRVTGGTITFGSIAVSFFFLTGGIYIAKSMESNKTAITFFKARILRIFPPLFAVVISSIIIGSFITEYNFMTYWTSTKTWAYLGNCVFILQHELPGVFLNNPYNSTINGSLWTLPVEFLCYIACFFFYRLKLLSKRFYLTIPVIMFGIFLYKSFFDIFVLNAMLQPCLLFYIGMFFYVYRDKITVSFTGFMFVIALGVVLLMTGLEYLSIILAFPYIVIYLMYGIRQCSNKIALLGKLSYGVYLSGFPIQQYIASYTHEPFVNFIIAIPVSIFASIILYQMVEKTTVRLFLKWKNITTYKID